MSPSLPKISTVRKRSGEVVSFDESKIANAISKVFVSIERDPSNAGALASKVVGVLQSKYGGKTPAVDDIHNLVEVILMAEGEFDAAKSYILYRSQRPKKKDMVIPDKVKELAAESSKHFRNPFAEFVYLRTYARWIESEGRRETWVETVDRYMDFMRENSGDSISEKDYKDLRTGILTQTVMPSMRLLQFAGKAVRKTNLAAYNCSFIAPTRLKDFADILYVCMCGTGVGFSVESWSVQKLPQIEMQTGVKKPIYVIADSKEGWSDALLEGMETWYSGEDIVFDYSKLRPAGARLHTMGGRSSGPDPLKSLLDFTRTTILNKQGRRLSSLEVHDIICKIGEIVVSGGVRRSALISLSDLDDMEMRDAKKGQFYISEPQRSMANNSAIYYSKPSSTQFLGEWLALMKSGSGERGIFNRSNLSTTLPQRRVDLLGDKIRFLGTNPCVPYETPILTSKGHVPIGSLVGTEVKVWNGNEWSLVSPVQTGTEEPTVIVALSDGTSLECTPAHNWILSDGTKKPAFELVVGDKLAKFSMPVCETGSDTFSGDAYSQGFYSGDGNRDYPFSWVYPPKYSVIPRLIGTVSTTESYGRKRWDHGKMRDKYFVPTNGTKEYILNWLAGFLDADGTAVKNENSYNVQAWSINKEFLLEIRLMLTRVGVQAKVVDATEAGITSMSDGRGGKKDYHTKECKRILLNATDLETLISNGMITNRLVLDDCHPNRDARRFVKVVSVEPTNETKDVFCFKEPINGTGTFNGIVTGQCGEIILQHSGGLCNLSEVVAREDDTEDTLVEKIRLATILGTFQSSLTNFPYVSSRWRKNAEEERLLGVSITGQWDCSVVRNASVLAKLKEVAISTNKKYAKKYGINESSAITCVKPSGTLSSVVDCSPGMHARHAPYYIRRVRVNTADPIFKMLRDQGVPYHPEVGQSLETATTMVLEFPIKSPDGAVFKSDISAIDQLEHWRLLKAHYTEHNPSCFSGDTKFLTDQGVKTFLETPVGSLVNVVGADGKFTPATVISGGEQEIWEIEIERCKIKHVIHTTENHVWPIQSPAQRIRGTTKNYTTKELLKFIGSNTYKLITQPVFTSMDRNSQAELHGIVFGDGTYYAPRYYDSEGKACREKAPHNQAGTTAIYLCNDPKGNDSRELANLFIQQGYKPVVRDDYEQIRFYSLPWFWKQLPGDFESPDYIRSFITGWFAADGHIDSRGICSLSSSNPEFLEWLIRIAPKAGISTTTRISKHENWTEGKYTPHYTVGIHKTGLDESFFLLEGKRLRFTPSKHEKHWKIVSVSNTGKTAPVFCVEEPKNHQFVLHGNILTGNCTITVGDDEWIEVGNWVYKNWDLVGGLSFLPKEKHVYQLAPYESITKEQYEERMKTFPTMDFSQLYIYEKEDQTEQAKELACVGGACAL